MKKILMTLVLLVGIAAGLFAQKLTYQAVIRDNNQQLVVNTAVKATVTIDFAGDQADYTTTIADVSTNLHGLLTIEFGDGSLVGRDWTGATIAVKVVNAATPSIVYVNDEPRSVSAVPYALSVDGVAIQQYLKEHKYVTEMQVGNQIHDSISNIAGKLHTHDNMAILNATTATYTKADSTKLKGIEAGAEVNVQSDWKQTDGSKDDYIKNKPSITDTVNGILSTGGYVTADALDSRHYLRSDSTVITTMQNDIVDLKASQLDCDKVKDCIKDTLSKYTPTADLTGVLQQLAARLDAQDAKMDSLAHLVDSLAKLPHGGDIPIYFTCGTDKVKDVDGNEYNTVKIGNQCWMKENLRTTKKPNGAAIAEGVYAPNNDNEKVETYGRLYTWSVVMNGARSTNYPESGNKVQGICPTGWHVPSDAEWDTLTDYVHNSTNPNYKCSGCSTTEWSPSTECIAKALASKTGWNAPPIVPPACSVGNAPENNDATGFSAVPAGNYDYGHYNDFGDRAFFWSATDNGNDIYSVARRLYIDSSNVIRGVDLRVDGFSVRCLRDAGGIIPVPVEVSCEQVMECMGDTLGKLNTKIEDLNATVTTQGLKLDSLAHVVDSLATLIPGGDTTEVADGQPCPGAATVSDGTNTYNTVKIGNQCWMKENLRTTTGLTENTNYWHANDQSANDETYGLLYNWAAVMQGKSTTNYPVSGDKVRGICPAGWHVPSNAEWTQLTTYVNSVADYKCNNVDNNIANALSDTTGWKKSSECGAGHGGSTTLNATGFSAVPAGNRLYNFSYFGAEAYFWSATEGTAPSLAWPLHLHRYNSIVISGEYSKGYGFSVRCLKDEGGSSATLPTVITASVTNITHNSATSGGDVTADGGANVTARGVCWSTNQNPTIADSHTADGSGTGSFSSSITGLSAGTTYYVRAYATNSKGTAYGEEVSFTTISLPTVTTASVTNITHNSATSGGDVTADGGANVTVRGVCWSTSQNPTIADSHTADGSGTGSFSSSITGLTSNTTYYVRAYATNSVGTAYGEEVSFTTISLPTVTTDSASTVTNNSAKLYGNVTDMGEYSEVNVGFKYGTIESALTSIVAKDAAMTATGLFSCDIDGLTVNTKYYFKAFAANGTDTVYGEVKNFRTLSNNPCPNTPTVTDIENNVYNTVQIGNQCWMAENLRTTTKRNNVGNIYTNNTTDGYNAETYGYYYDWAAVMQNESGDKVQGICPTGWHVPSDAEWTQLTTYVNSVADYKCNNVDNNIANALSAATGWESPDECGAGHNSTTLNKTGFSAVSAGRCLDGSFGAFGRLAYYWSATQDGDGYAWYRGLLSDASHVRRNYHTKDFGFSVRCLKDN